MYMAGGKGCRSRALRVGRSGHRGPGKPCQELQHALEIEDVTEGLKQVGAGTRCGYRVNVAAACPGDRHTAASRTEPAEEPVPSAWKRDHGRPTSR